MMNASVAIPPLVHQPPFRLLDRVVRVDLAAGQLDALRRLTASDAAWPAEASARPSAPFPQLLVIEALCQAAACLNGLELAASPRASVEASGIHLGYLVAISNFRFQEEMTLPAKAAPSVGDTLLLEVARQGRMGSMVAFEARASVLAEPGPARQVACGRLLFAVAPK